MMDVRVRLVQLLVKHGKYPIISEHLGDTAPAQQSYISSRMQGLGCMRYFEFFNPQQAHIEALLNETQRGVKIGQALPLMMRQLISGRGFSLTDSIAVFLIVRGNYSYYSASTGWFDKDWHWESPQYDAEYGAPLADAVSHDGGVYTREFSGCSVVVTCVNSGRKSCTGSISMKTNATVKGDDDTALARPAARKLSAATRSKAAAARSQLHTGLATTSQPAWAKNGADVTECSVCEEAVSAACSGGVGKACSAAICAAVPPLCALSIVLDVICDAVASLGCKQCPGGCGPYICQELSFCQVGPPPPPLPADLPCDLYAFSSCASACIDSQGHDCDPSQGGGNCNCPSCDLPDDCTIRGACASGACSSSTYPTSSARRIANSSAHKTTCKCPAGTTKSAGYYCADSSCLVTCDTVGRFEHCVKSSLR